MLKPFSLVLAGWIVAACLAASPAVVPAPTPTTAAPPALAAGPSQPPSVAPNLPPPTPGRTDAATANPAPTAAPPAPPTPTPTPRVFDPPAKAGKFTMDVYRERAHVRQANNSMCVPASMQIMINLMSGAEPDRSRETQQELYTLARSYSPWLTAARGGASARGWAAGLNDLGYGDFQLVALPSIDDALRRAAHQMRFTGKPVGLLVWRGDHAWVMSGFKASADPAWTDDFDVSAVWIEDPWFGRTDRTWGTGLAPHTLVSRAELADDFVVWTAPHLSALYGAERWYLVLPMS